MKPTFLQRLAYWCSGRINGETVEVELYEAYPLSHKQMLELSGANNVPVEDLGGTPVFYENGQPVYWEHAP